MSELQIEFKSDALKFLSKQSKKTASPLKTSNRKIAEWRY